MFRVSTGDDWVYIMQQCGVRPPACTVSVSLPQCQLTHLGSAACDMLDTSDCFDMVGLTFPIVVLTTSAHTQLQVEQSIDFMLHVILTV